MERGNPLFELNDCTLQAYHEATNRIYCSYREARPGSDAINASISTLQGNHVTKTVDIEDLFPFYTATFNPDGTELATLEQATLLFWDTETGEKLREIPINANVSLALRYTQDGRFLIAGSQTTIFDTTTWKK